MQLSGVIVAYDGEEGGIADLLDAPFYGGKKLLMRDKVLSDDITLPNGEPLVSSPIRALFDASVISDVVVVGHPEQATFLENLCSKYSQGKPYSVVSSSNDIGDNVGLASEAVMHSGYVFFLQPDLPLVTGNQVDLASFEILNNQGASVYLPVISRSFFQQFSDGWQRPFFAELQMGDNVEKLKMLDFVVASSQRINPEFVRKFYGIRMIRSLKGKVNAFREFPNVFPRVALAYVSGNLSVSDLEEMASNLNGDEVKVVQLSNPAYASFMKDIDTMSDYQSFLKSVNSNGNLSNAL